MSGTDNDVDNISSDSDVDTETETRPKVIKNDESDEENEEEENIEDEETGPYVSQDFISGPKISKNGTLPMDVLDFHFSFGYNCRKKFNIVVLDKNTVAFASGNFINFFNIETRDVWFRRSALGGGIGHIRKNPNSEYPHFAVAESGRHPIIIMYEWPSLDIVCILRGGAERIYANMDFSPDGELLVSQSGEPDFLITVWKWHEHKILLRNKSYVNDVYRVKFSPYVPGQITTCGLAHIKFWKMATTFTGLKLKGELGRFGRTEYSDILGTLPMPDEKVVSGCEWGNILVWDAGLITLEIYRSLRRKCHDAPIVQFYYNEGELWSVSMDGHIRVWWYEKIEQADPPDNDRVILTDPSYDFYTPGLMLYCAEKRFVDDPTDSLFIIQDGNGGIWQIDLNTEEETKPSVLLYKCHAGKVVDIASCPYGPYLASLGFDGRIYLYNYLEKKLVFSYEFPAKGACMIWLALEIIETGDIILSGFDDGQIRVCCIDITKEEEVSITVSQIIKPHNKPITKMSANTEGTILVSGSEDCTIFVFQIDTSENAQNLLVPIGFVPAPDVITCICWHYDINEDEVLIGCDHGKMMQVQIPRYPQPYTEVSHLLQTAPKFKNFTTYKAQIRRNIKIKEIEIRKAKKVAKKRKEMEVIKKENPGLEIDEEVFLADSESEEELDPLFIPEIPNKILWLRYTEDNTIWLSMGGYDAGYIYEYLIDQKEEIPHRFQMIYDGDDIEISSYVYDYNKTYLIFAMQDGSIRVNKVNQNDFRDLSDYWIISMHDNQHGFVPKMCFSYDEQYFFSCGHDGNIFSYLFQPKEFSYKETSEPKERVHFLTSVKDLDTYAKMSLEETKMKSEDDRIMKVANENKVNVRDILKTLKERYAKLLLRNSMLLPSQIIPREDLEPDKRVTEHIDKEFDDKLKLVKRKLAYDLEKSEVQMKKLLKYFTDPVDKHPIVVKGINDPKVELLTVRQRVMSPMFNKMMQLVEEKIIEEQSKGRPPERAQGAIRTFVPKSTKATTLEYFLLSLSPSVIEAKLGPKLHRMLNKYRLRREKWERRLEKWDEFMTKKPIPEVNHPDDEKLLSEARNTIGEFKLKESSDYKAPPDQRETTVKKYKQVLDTRLKQYGFRHRFIQKVWDIRDLKYVVRQNLIDDNEQLLLIQAELPEALRVCGPNIPEVNKAEFPEEHLKPKVVLPEEEEEVLKGVPAQKFVEQPTKDEEEKELLPERATFPPMVDTVFVSDIPSDDIEYVSELDFNLLCDHPENIDTLFETDLRVNRLNRKLFQQKQIIASMELDIKNFNNTIEEAKKERLPIHVGGNFIDIYILTLNQELNILKKFEDGEDQLSDKVHENLKLVHSLEDEIDTLTNKKENHEVEIENYHSEEAKIHEKFKHAAENNKFYDFLRKVFKKKYKPPKQIVDEDGSSESSSSSSDDSDVDETASIDSRDFGFIRQDLNVCPKGCELAIYNFTVDLRSKRHEIEQEERDRNRILETVKKDIELNKRKLTILHNQLQSSQVELEKFQREKQNRLNQVKCTVILKLDQMHNFNPEYSEISDFLVFSKTTLSNLYKRVGTLEFENFQQKSKYDLYLKHLTRLKKDLGYMKEKIQNLKNQIIDMMNMKFGKTLDINEVELQILQKSFNKTHVNELEEVVLKKLVYDLRLKSTDIKGLYIAELNKWNSKIIKTQNEVAQIIKDNTKRLELLQVMSREKREMVKMISSQPKKREQIEKIKRTHTSYLQGIDKLEKIIEYQCKQLQELKIEIKMLKTKGLPSKESIKEEFMDSIRKKEQADDEGVKEWIDYDKYIDEQFEQEDENQFVQEIAVPGYYATESENIVTDLLKEMLENMNIESSEESVKEMVDRILSGILRSVSMNDIVTEILNSLPLKPSEKQQIIIDETAEKLYQVHDIQASEESFSNCARELLENTIDNIMTMKGESHEILAKMVETLVESIPVDYLMKEDSIEVIINKIFDSLGEKQMDTDSLKKKVESISSVYKDEMIEIINVILDKVFSTGIEND